MTRGRICWPLLLLTFFGFPILVVSQTISGDTTETVLPLVQVEATRATEVEATAPLSLSIVSRTAEERQTEAPRILSDLFAGVPGVWMSDRGHFAEGERISVRGMGWRASFGVRGIGIVLDGIPLTMPDGQALTEMVDPNFVERIEVLRGPSSLFWGNGSGGVIHFSTPAPEKPGARFRAATGTYGYRYLGVTASGGEPGRKATAFVSSQWQDGYRQFANGVRRRGAVILNLNASRRTTVRVIAGFADQFGNSPGALSAAEMALNPRLANSRNLDFRAHKSSFQGQSAVQVLRQTPHGLLDAGIWGVARRLENALPYDVFIPIERAAAGTRFGYTTSGEHIGVSVGVDAGIQRDDRQNWNNDHGFRGNTLLLDQLEQVTSLAAFGIVRWYPVAPLRVTAGLRMDRVRFDLWDDYRANGDQSGNRTFLALSPGVGVSYTLGDLLLYTDYTTAFETPTTTELVNRPDLTGGFNRDLRPQRVHGIEAGTRFAPPSGFVAGDVAVFYLLVQDQLEQFQTDLGGDRDFFRNGGDNRHAGFEASVVIRPHPSIRLTSALTLIQARFTNGINEDRKVPGLPERLMTTRLEARKFGFRGTLSGMFVSRQYVDNANTAFSEGFALVDAGLGYTGIRLPHTTWYPFISVSNLFDVRYVGSVNINASTLRGNYFEPGGGRSITAGMTLSL